MVPGSEIACKSPQKDEAAPNQQYPHAVVATEEREKYYNLTNRKT